MRLLPRRRWLVVIRWPKPAGEASHEETIAGRFWLRSTATLRASEVGMAALDAYTDIPLTAPEVFVRDGRRG